RDQRRLPMVIESWAWAVAVASSLISLDKRSLRLTIVPGKSRTLRRAAYFSSRGVFFWRLSRWKPASGPARVAQHHDPAAPEPLEPARHRHQFAAARTRSIGAAPALLPSRLPRPQWSAQDQGQAAQEVSALHL